MPIYFPSQLDVVQTATPTTGQTVVMTDSSQSGTLYLTPAGTLAALTVTLLSNANSVIGQIRRIGTNNIITTLTINGAASILGTVTTIALGVSASFQKVASDTWIKI